MSTNETVEHIPTSALVRRLLRQAIHEQRPEGVTEARLRDIARSVVREELRSL